MKMMYLPATTVPPNRLASSVPAPECPSSKYRSDFLYLRTLQTIVAHVNLIQYGTPPRQAIPRPHSYKSLDQIAIHASDKQFQFKR